MACSVVLFFSFLIAILCYTHQVKANHEVPKTVLIYGDSNTLGFNPEMFVNRSVSARYSFHQRWTQRLSHHLGASYHIISEGLNARTTIHKETFLGYEVNGRSYLPIVMHSHTPIDLVVLALNTNDFKKTYHCQPSDVVQNVLTLVKDILKMKQIGPTILSPPSSDSQQQQQPRYINKPIKILILGCPALQSTRMNKKWGFPAEIAEIAKEFDSLMSLACQKENIPYLSLLNVGVSPVDGIHFALEHQEILGKMIAEKISSIL